MLGILLISTALSQSDGYSLPWSTVDSGGATLSSGGGYTLGGTIGQPDAASLSGGSYVLEGGFWGIDLAAGAPISPLYLPSIRKENPVAVVPVCPDDVEPNNGQTQAKRLTTIGSACKATLAAGSDEEDWYWVDLPPGAKIIIDMKDISGGANNDIQLVHFKPAYSSDGKSANAGNAAEHIEYTRSASDTTPCNPNQPSESGCRFIWIYHAASSPNPNTYILQVVIQQ
jgi:hypothetical protein